MKAYIINKSSAHKKHWLLQTIKEWFKFYQYFECFQPLWETVWQGTVMGWRSQAARRPRMPSPDYFSVVPTLMDPTLTSKYLMDLSILLYLKIQTIFYMYWSVLFWHYRYHVNICNNVLCYIYIMITTKCTYYRQINHLCSGYHVVYTCTQVQPN